MISWSVFITAFVFIFIAALPGRTTFVMLIMAARERPWGIFLGAALAFAIQSGISVLLGGVLVLLPQYFVQFATGLLFLLFSLIFWRESRHGIVEPRKASHNSFVVAVRSAFLVIFAAEWGDVSQVAIASSAARTNEQITVFLSAVSALWIISNLAVVTGSRLHTVINPNIIQKFASIIFLSIGVYLCISGISGFST